MGNAKLGGLKVTSHEQLLRWLSLESMHDYFKNHKAIPRDLLNRASIIPSNDDLRQIYGDILMQMGKTKCFEPEYLPFENKEVERCVAALLGLGICDALGAST
jgi:hypothetical protein